MFSADRDVVQMGHTRGRVVATGIPFDIAEVHRWTVRHGRVVAAHFSIDTAAMLSALAAG
jgi:ketosteroid isomerase-like protein